MNLSIYEENLLIYGTEYGNVFIKVQPAFDYRGNPLLLQFSNLAAHIRNLQQVTLLF